MSRPLTEGEIALARSIFGDAIDHRRVRLSTRPFGPWAITFWSSITFPPQRPAPADFVQQSVRLQAWLVHELVHVWQFQTRPMWTILSWAGVVLSGGYGPGLPGYRYAWPLKDWGAHNLEQQAAMVEHAFMLRQTGRCVGAPAGAALADYRACAPFEL